MQDIHAWRRPAENDTRKGTLAQRAEDVTAIFFSRKQLRDTEHLLDGFQDAGGSRDPSTPAASFASASDVTLLLDRSADARLADFYDFASKQLRKTSDPVSKVMVTALVVSEALGRSGGDASALEQRCEEATFERMDKSRGIVRLGDLIGDRRGAAAQQGQSKVSGAGGARHRAILFKALADWLEVAPCTLARGSNSPSCWNAVAVDGGNYVVDVMFEPGALYEEGSGRASAYIQALSKGGQSKKGKGTFAPSMQEDVTGRIARPPWHVEPWEVDFDRTDRAGRGGFGEVFMGKWAGQPVAVKEVKDTAPSDADICNFVLEIALLSGLSHPNIVRFWRGCVDLRGGSRTLLFLTEWMDRGVLSDLLHERKDVVLEPAQRLVLASGVAKGTGYLHDVGVLHLDLKSPNVLLNSKFQTKLCDFGLAKVREQVGIHTTLIGVSPVWAPPEMFDDTLGTISDKADVYSFGIIMFELFTQEMPFKDLNQMQMTRAKSKGQLPKFPAKLDEDVKEFIRQLLAQRPVGRPKMQAAMTVLKQLARARQVDLAKKQADMEAAGFHPQVPGGRAEELAVEAEIARLSKLIEEEQAKMKLVEEKIRQKGLTGGGQDFQKYLAKHTEKLAEMKYQCTLCMKMFRGEEFVHKHIQEKHFSEMLLGASGGPAAGALKAQGLSIPAQADAFFDTDVAEEANAQSYTQRVINGDIIPGAGGQLAQPMQDAAKAGDLDKIQQFLHQDGSALRMTDPDGCTLLHLSGMHNQYQVVHHLLASAADASAVNENGFTALHLAAQDGQLRACEVLLRGGAPLNAADRAKSRMPLHLAAAGAHVGTCNILLSQKASVNAQDSEGQSPLHNAARSGSRPLCELILSWGAAVNAVDNEGWTPLHEASRWGDGELVEALLARAADPLAASNDGESPLHVVPGGYAEQEVVLVLLAKTASANAVDYDGETPLHVAVKLGDDGLVQLLLENGADANSKSRTGATPLDLAKKDEIKWLLRAHKARRGAQ